RRIHPARPRRHGPSSGRRLPAAAQIEAELASAAAPKGASPESLGRACRGHPRLSSTFLAMKTWPPRDEPGGGDLIGVTAAAGGVLPSRTAGVTSPIMLKASRRRALPAAGVGVRR